MASSQHACKEQNTTAEWRQSTHLDEAVMEMQPDEGRRHPGLPGDGLCHDGLHNLLGLGTRMVVELREEAAAVPRVAADGAGEEEGRHEAERHQANHGSRHGYRCKQNSTLHCTMLQVTREELLDCLLSWVVR